MYSCSFLTISGTIASGSCFFAIRRNVCSSQRYSIISSTVALSLCTLFAVYCALLRYHTALSVLPTQAHRLAVHAGIHHPLFVLLICIETFLTPNTVQLMMYTTLNAPVCPSLSFSLSSVFYPRLFPGDRVARGPDWQWGNQGNGEEGEVIEEKSWKGVEGCAVRVRWDNDDQNVYRYGAEHCYDVILCLFLSWCECRVNPMLRDDFVPDGGFDACSEGSGERLEH